MKLQRTRRMDRPSHSTSSLVFKPICGVSIALMQADKGVYRDFDEQFYCFCSWPRTQKPTFIRSHTIINGATERRKRLFRQQRIDCSMFITFAYQSLMLKVSIYLSLRKYFCYYTMHARWKCPREGRRKRWRREGSRPESGKPESNYGTSKRLIKLNQSDNKRA